MVASATTRGSTGQVLRVARMGKAAAEAPETAAPQDPGDMPPSSSLQLSPPVFPPGGSSKELSGS